MPSRLRKGINRQRLQAYSTALKKHNKYKQCADCGSAEVCDSADTPQHGKLPRPQNLNVTQKHKRQTPPPTRQAATYAGGTGQIIKSTSVPYDKYEQWETMRRHSLWVRIFDVNDDLLFNHMNPEKMHISQMVQLCTKLVNHLNSISQTDELTMQKALGTLESTIVAQLTPPLDGKSQYHSWNLQDPNSSDVYYNVGAVTIITQTNDKVFNGQLIDDYIGITLQLC